MNILTGVSKEVKEKIHPKYQKTIFRCACGHKVETRSTLGVSAKDGMVSVDICSNCHPFYTGKQKLVDTAGRVDRFLKKYKNYKKESKSKEN